MLREYLKEFFVEKEDEISKENLNEKKFILVFQNRSSDYAQSYNDRSFNL